MRGFLLNLYPPPTLRRRPSFVAVYYACVKLALPTTLIHSHAVRSAMIHPGNSLIPDVLHRARARPLAGCRRHRTDDLAGATAAHRSPRRHSLCRKLCPRSPSCDPLSAPLRDVASWLSPSQILMRVGLPTRGTVRLQGTSPAARHLNDAHTSLAAERHPRAARYATSLAHPASSVSLVASALRVPSLIALSPCLAYSQELFS
jgi:hypothetical protein